MVSHWKMRQDQNKVTLGLVENALFSLLPACFPEPTCNNQVSHELSSGEVPQGANDILLEFLVCSIVQQMFTELLRVGLGSTADSVRMKQTKPCLLGPHTRDYHVAPLL